MATKEFTYKLKIDSEIGDLESKLKQAQKQVEQFTDGGKEPKITKIFEQLGTQIDSLKSKAGVPIRTKGAFSSMEKDVQKIDRLLESLGDEFTKISQKTAKEKIQFLPKEAKDQLEKVSTSLNNYVAHIQKAQETAAKYNEAQKQQKERQQELEEATKKYTEALAAKEKAEQEGKGAEEMQAFKSAVLQAKSEVDSLNGQIGTLNGRVAKLGKDSKDTKATMSNDFHALRNEAQALGIDISGIGDRATAGNIEKLQVAFENFINNGAAPVDNSLKQVQQTLTEFQGATENTNKVIETSVTDFEKQNEAAGQVDGLLSRIKQFTGLTGAALIARRALRNAISTIKDLDKQMTAMAVVTDLEVGDYWKQLPEHTARANALGMAIKDVYEAETLYYQQGLKTAQVTQLSTSTLKMARIAGLSAEDATNKMTAALRGFNMEINQTNADRIADVYSKLAAITASNVQEISTAMTKTASLAANAGMQFETTAAFLSQIIETTRESAETAGTALKTVIARFQELKKAPEEIGEVDGEIVDANKIETALRTVGVALRDTSGQFRNLDEVFLELASKWDGLDTNTQRYIATIAAGSRQQSRFIAMMSDYGRTQELVSAANNAAGASNEQFEKTLESLESKLAALKNAWDTFTMGIANSSLIKTGIDILTGLLNAVNFITEKFGEWPGMALKIGMVTTALIVGDKALKAFMASMKLGNGILASLGAAVKAPFSAATKSISKLTTTTMMYNKSVFGTKKSVTSAMAADAAYMKQIKAEDAAKRNNVKGTQENTAAENQLTQAKQRASIAQQNLAIQMGWYNTTTKQATVQGAVYNKLVSAGVAPSEAAALAAQTNAEATEEEAMADAIAAGQKAGIIVLKGAEATAENIDTEATKKNTIEKQQNTLADSKGIIGMLMRLGLRILGKKATDEESKSEGKNTAAKGANIVTTLMQAAANGTLLATMWPILVATLAIAAAILILVGLFFLLKAIFEGIKASTPEGKFEAASEALDKATDAANQASEAYNDLKDSLSELNDKYDALDELTVGTQEWRDALLDVNAQVMDLIDKYPELADAMEVDANGVMRISEEAQKQVLAEKAAVNARAQTAKMAAQINKNEAKANLEYSKLSDKAIAGDQSADTWKSIGQGAKIGAAAGGMMSAGLFTGVGAMTGAIAGGIAGHAISRENNREKTDELAKALGANKLDQDELKKYMTETMKMAPDEAQQWIEDLDKDTLKKLKEYGQTLNENAKAQAAAMQTMISNSLAMIDTSKYTAEQIKQMNNIGTQLMEDVLSAQEQAIKALDKNEFKDKAEEYYNELGEDVEVDKNGNVTYKNGDQEVKLTKEQAEAQLAAADAADEMKNKLELLPKALSNAMSQKGGAALNKAFNDKEGKGLSRQDVTALSGNALKELYENNAELQEVYQDFSKFEEEMTKRTSLATQAFKQNAETLASIGMEGFTFDQKLTAEAEKGLIEQIQQVVAVSGADEGKRLGEHINSILNSVAEEDRDKVVAQLNSIDWHNVADLESLPDVFKEIGINIPHQDLVNLIDDLKNTAHAVQEVDFEKLNESLITVNKFIKDIYSNDQTREVDDSVYETLVSIDPNLANLFGQNLEGGYVFLGESMQDLGKIIVDKTNELVKIGTEQIQNKIDTADVLDNLFGNGTKTFSGGTAYNMANSGNWNESQQRQFIQDVINEANRTGTSLEGVARNLSNDTNVQWLDKDQLKEIINSLKGIYGQQTALTNQMEKDAVAAYSKAYQSSNVYRNTANELSQKAQTGKLTETEKAQYQGQRNAVLIQAVSAGMSEQDLKKVTELDKKMRELEADGKTGTEQYKKYAKAMTYFSKQLAGMTGYQNMRNQLQDIITLNNDLMESYKKTSDEQQKMFLTKQMLQDFDIKVTEKNYEYLAGLVNDYLHGDEEGFISIINLAGQAAGIEAEAYASMANMTMEAIQEMGDEYIKFADDMIAKGYAMWDSTGKLIWGTATIKDLAKEIVEEIEKWESPYNWLYNMNSKINALMKERELLERDFQRAINDTNKSAADMAENLTQQISLLEQATLAEKSRYDSAKQQMLAYVDEINNNPVLSSLQGAIAIGPSGQIVVDKELLATAGYSADEGSVIEDMISAIGESYDTMSDSLDQIEDNTDTIAELRKTGKDQYNSLLERVRDALEQLRQQEIDKLSNINDSINDAASKLVSKIQEQIDDQRQERANKKTEENIQDKQARLAYLQSSGGSALDILKLQKEIANDQESYQDTLIDQTLDEMQKANDKAADQRQAQIDIAQAQLDYWSENESWKEAEQVLNASIAEVRDGVDPLDTDLGNILSKAESLDTKAYFQKEDWKESLGGDVKLATLFESMNSPAFTDENSVFGKLKTTANTAQETIGRTEAEVKQDFTTLEAGNTDLLGDEGQFKVDVSEIARVLKAWEDRLKAAQEAQGPSGSGETPPPVEVPEAQAQDATGIKDYEKQVGKDVEITGSGGGNVNERIMTATGSISAGVQLRNDKGDTWNQVSVNGKDYYLIKQANGEQYYINKDALTIQGDKAMFNRGDARYSAQDRYVKIGSSNNPIAYYDRTTGDYISPSAVQANGTFDKDTLHYKSVADIQTANKYSGDDYKSVVENGVQKFYLAADKYMEKIEDATDKVSKGLADAVGDTLDNIDEKFSGDLKDAVKAAIDAGVKTTADGAERTGNEIDKVLTDMSEGISDEASVTFQELAGMGVTFSEETCKPITDYVNAEAEESRKKIEQAQQAVADAQKAYNEATTDELKADAKVKLEEAQANLKDVTEKQLGILTACGEVGQEIMDTSSANGGVAITSVASAAKAGIQGILDLVNNGDDTIKALLGTVTSAAEAALAQIGAAIEDASSEIPEKEPLKDPREVLPKNIKGGGGCFIGETPVLLKDYRTKLIKDIGVNEIIMAYDENEKSFVEAKVLHTFRKESYGLIKIIFEDNTELIQTPGHPLLTTEGWKSRDLVDSLLEHHIVVSYLNIGDIVIGIQNKTISKIINLDPTYKTDVYTLEVEKYHNFIVNDIVAHNIMIAQKMELQAFATGGLAEFTGPAWIDGTKSAPELVLNATDTANFIQLKDILSEILRNNGHAHSGSAGDNYYDIKVQVDSIDSDYDVDQAVERMKELIEEDARYRNVTAVNKTR